MSRAAVSRLTSVIVLLGLAGFWQLLSILMPWESVPGERMIPGWQVVFSKTLLSLSDYWAGGLGVPAVAEGGDRTYAGALLAILSNSWDTSLRML